VILVAYVIRRFAGPPERDPHEPIREQEAEPTLQTE
jgi:hypothetical protein